MDIYYAEGTKDLKQDDWINMYEEVEYETVRIGNIANTILGGNLLPSYPIFVLSIVQTVEANMNNAAYNY